MELEFSFRIYQTGQTIMGLWEWGFLLSCKLVQLFSGTVRLLVFKLLSLGGCWFLAGELEMEIGHWKTMENLDSAVFLQELL